MLRNKATRRISVRVPHWVDRRELRADVSGKRLDTGWIGRHLVFADLAPGAPVTLTFPVHETTARYTVNAHSEYEQAYTCTFRAGTMVDIAPRDEAPTSYPLNERDSMRRNAAPMKAIERFVPDRLIRNW